MNCADCGEPVYGHAAHPCCIHWAKHAPGKPCVGCFASREHARRWKPRPNPSVYYEPADQYICDNCGLSDVGASRLQRLGFAIHPCLHCAEHRSAA